MAVNTGLGGEGEGSRDENATPFQPYDIPGDVGPGDYWDELGTQTDRGVAVLGASYLEWRIRGAIKIRFAIWDKHAEHVFGTDLKGAKLGFWEQSEVAFGLGIIGPVTLSDLSLIGQIRNKFAHNPSIRSFDHPIVAALADRIQTPEFMADRIDLLFANNPSVGKQQRLTERRDIYLHATHEIANAIWEVGRFFSTVPKPELKDCNWW